MYNFKIKDALTDFLLYTTTNDDIKIETCLYNETLWLSQKIIAELFGIQQITITKHLKNIFNSEKLEEKSVNSILKHTINIDKKYQARVYPIKNFTMNYFMTIL